VAVLRTGLVDSGLGLAIFEIFKKEDEDRRVLSAALSAVCNIVNEFSPLKAVSVVLLYGYFSLIMSPDLSGSRTHASTDPTNGIG
jgi:armadillo repeat-containing protein 8